MKNQSSINQVIDYSIIDRNPWFLYGSGKPDDTPYKVTKTYKVKYDNDRIYSLHSTKTHCDELLFVNMANLFSSTYATIKDDVDIDELNSTCYHNSNYQDIRMIIPDDTIKKPYSNDVELRKYIKELLDLLNVNRADNYDDWWKVGQILYNISWAEIQNWYDRYLFL